MIRLVLPLLLAALLFGRPAGADPLQGPLDFQSFVLGTTLEEARRKGHPDKEPGDDIWLICAGDPLARESGKNFDPGDKLARAGVKVCKFIQRTSGKWEEALFRVGRHKLLTLFYFTPRTGDPATSERLYYITAAVPLSTYDDIAAAVKGQYGEPETDGLQPVRDRAGRPRDTRRMVWNTANSIVVIQERGERPDIGLLAYADHYLSDIVDRASKAGEADALPSPFGLPGFNLGMTLDEIRRQKHPDGDFLELVCTGDPRATEQFGLTPGADYHALGVRTCRYFLFRKQQGDVLEAPMKVEGYYAQVIFLFTPSSGPPATAERLFRIWIAADPAHFAGLLRAYWAKLGKPGNDHMIPQVNSQRLSRTLIWEGTRSRLFMSESMPRPGGDRTIITFNDIALEKALEKAEQALKKKSGAGR